MSRKLLPEVLSKGSRLHRNKTASTNKVTLKREKPQSGSVIEITSGCILYERSPENPVDNGNEYKKKYFSLLKSFDELKIQLKRSKELNLKQSNELCQERKRFEELNNEHDLCKSQITAMEREIQNYKNEIDILQNALKDMKTQFASEVAHGDGENPQLANDDFKELNFKYQNEIEELLNEKHALIAKIEDLESEIKSKTSAIENLKWQARTNIEKDSAERRNQIQDLVKELKRVSDEAETVKTALKRFKANKSDCQKCSFYESKCLELTQDLVNKDETLKEFVNFFSQYKNHMNQQDEFLKLIEKLKLNM